MELSELLKEYRKVNNLSQTDLANKLYVSKQAVSKWETKRGYPDINTLKDIALLLDCSIDELVGLEKKEIKNNKKKLFLIISLFLSIISIFLLIFFIVRCHITDRKTSLINKTEEELKITLPKVESFDEIKYDRWYQADPFLPKDMYYFIFKYDLMIDNSWMNELNNDLLNNINIDLYDYPTKCDYFKLVSNKGINNDININTINIIEYHLYCYIKEEKRLICIIFNQ